MRKNLRLIYSVSIAFLIAINFSTIANADVVKAKRLSGQDRIATALEISKEKNQINGTIVITNGANFADALAGAAFCSLKGNATVLLTDPLNMDSKLLTEIDTRKPSQIFILGGTGAVSSEIETVLNQHCSSVKRIYGDDRYKTAVSIGEYVEQATKSDTVFLAYGKNYPDALAASTFAAKKGIPILFTGTNNLNTDTQNALVKWNIKNVVILGGVGIIAPTVETELNSMNIKTTRIGGINRYDTAKLILQKYYDNSYNGLTLCTGEDFPDSLAGVSLAVEKSMPIMLYSKNISSDVTDYIKSKFNAGYIIGGTGVLAEDDVCRLQGITSITQKIKDKWILYKPSFTGNKYTIMPQIKSPYIAGKLNIEFLNDSLKMTNFVRYLAGLPDDLVLDDELTNQAQYGSVLLGSSSFSHTPTKPDNMDDSFYAIGYKSTSSSNIGSGYDSIASSISYGYMRDEDTGNIDRLGHRRWILNPQLKKVGFGFLENNNSTYTTMQVFDSSRVEKVDYNYVAWPNSEYFPTEFFSGMDPWSITLNPQKYSQPDISKVEVKLTNMANNKSWILNQSNNVVSTGKYFNVNNIGYGVSNCIIFRPDGIEKYNNGDIYAVSITGLKDKSNNNIEISYKVNFFNLEQR